MGGVFNCVNGNLYHYAGNSPVKYTDPDGKWVKNDSNQHIVIKTEDKGFVVLPPHKKYDGKDVEKYEYKDEDSIDNGKVDGVILSDGSIFKVTDTKKNPFTINITVKQDKDGNVKAHYGDAVSFFISKFGDFVKRIKDNRKDHSGNYKVGIGDKAGKWLERKPDQEKMKKYANNKQSFIPKDEINKIED